MNKGYFWTDDEFEVVRTLWPDIDEIARRLPYRSRHMILNAASRCRVRRHIHFWTSDQDLKLRRMARAGIPRREIAKALGLEHMQVQNRMTYAGIKAGRQPYKPTGHTLTDSIRERVFALNMTLAELDTACGSGEHFQRCGRKGVAHRHLWKALEVLGGKLRIEWDV